MDEGSDARVFSSPLTGAGRALGEEDLGPFQPSDLFVGFSPWLVGIPIWGEPSGNYTSVKEDMTNPKFRPVQHDLRWPEI